MKKQSIPIYNDGRFKLFKLVGDDGVYEKKILKDLEMNIWYREISVGDRIKNELSQNGIEIITKITIPQYKKIGSMNVVEIDNELLKVYNAYHFTNNDGFDETTLTLERYRK